MIKKKLLSLFLAICMLVSLMPTFAFAVDDDPVDPTPSNPGEMRFTCKNEAITGGSIYYKLNNTGDFIKVSEENNQYSSITLTDEATSITIRLAVNDGYELDTVRGVSLSINGNEAFSSTDDNIAEFTSEQGYTFNLSELIGDSSVSESSFELEFGFGTKSDDPAPVDPTPSNPGEMRFTCKNEAITGGSIYYKLNNTGDFIKVSEENNQYSSITLTDEATSITIRLAVNDGYELDTVRGVSLSINGNEAFSSTDDNIAEFTSEQGYTFNLSELIGDSSVSESSFELEFGFGTKSNDPNPENPPHPGYEGDKVSADLTITGDADFYINDSKMINIAGGNNASENVEYTYNNTDKNIDFYICCHINKRYTSFKVNGEEYVGLLPTPDTDEGKEALLEACKGQINEFKIVVPYADSYVIEATQKVLDDTDADYMVVGNFLWTYLEENSQSDDYLDNGRMELLSATYKGEDYKPDVSTGMGWSQSELGGEAVLPVGTIVTVKLVPDYGYQLTSFGINGGDFGTGDEQSVFTFEIKPGNFHLGAHFTPVEDRVTSTAQTVTEGSIELGSSGLAGGSAQLKISDASLNQDKKTGFGSVTPSGYTVTDYLNIDLYNVYYKGTDNPDDVWESAIDTLKEDATIRVQLSDSQLVGVVDPSDIVILHNVHNGDIYEAIPIDSYDPETNTITFKTDSFSTYAIAATAAGHTHVYGDWTTTKAPTCTEKGVQTRTCLCGAFETKEIPATGHKAVTDKAVSATCTKTGLTEGSHCSVCGAVIKAQTEVPATGHKAVTDSAVAPSCTKTGLTAGSHCSVCNAVIKAQTTVPATGHKYVATVVKPTYTAQGYTLHKCSVCGASYKDTYKAKLTLSTVTGLKLGGRAADALRLNWTKNANASGYIIEQYKNGKWVRIAKITKNTTTTYRVSGLKAGTAYKFRVKAYRMSGKTAIYSKYTKTLAARTNPSKVSGLKIGGKASTALRLNWAKNSSADGYIIEMYKGGKWVRAAKITKNSTVTYKKSGLAKNTTYKFRIKAYKMSGKTAIYSGYTTISGKTTK